MIYRTVLYYIGHIPGGGAAAQHICLDFLITPHLWSYRQEHSTLLYSTVCYCALYYIILCATVHKCTEFYRTLMHCAILYNTAL